MVCVRPTLFLAAKTIISIYISTEKTETAIFVEDLIAF